MSSVVEARLRRNARRARDVWCVSAVAFCLMTAVDLVTDNGDGGVWAWVVSWAVAIWFVIALMVWWLHARALHDWQTSNRTWRAGR